MERLNMKLLKWFTKRRISWLEVTTTVIMIVIFNQYNSYWLYLLFIPFGFMNGILSVYVRGERPTLYFDHFDSAKDYMLNNLSEMRETGADITIKNPLNSKSKD